MVQDDMVFGTNCVRRLQVSHAGYLDSSCEICAGHLPPRWIKLDPENLSLNTDSSSVISTCDYESLAMQSRLCTCQHYGSY